MPAKLSPSPVRFFGWILAGTGVASLVGMVWWTVMGIRVARDAGTVSPALAQFVALAPIPLVLALLAVFGGALLVARNPEEKPGC